MIPHQLMEWSPVRLQQGVNACLSISTVLSVPHVLGSIGTPETYHVLVEELERLVKDSASKKQEAETNFAELRKLPDLAKELQK